MGKWMWSLVLLSLSVAACAPTTIGKNWGTAYRQAKANQVLDPAAGDDLSAVEGQEGKVAAMARDAYRKGFEKPNAGFERSIVSSGVQTR